MGAYTAFDGRGFNLQHNLVVIRVCINRPSYCIRCPDEGVDVGSRDSDKRDAEAFAGLC